MAARYQSVDEYIVSFPAEVQQVLEAMRQMVKEAAPQAEEVISYDMPTFRWSGGSLHFAAWKNHVGFYGRGNAVLETFEADVAPYVGARGSLRFPLDKPLPLGLIRDIVRVSVAGGNAEGPGPGGPSS